MKKVKATLTSKVTKLTKNTAPCWARFFTCWVWWLSSPCCFSSSLASALKVWQSLRWFFTKRVEVGFWSCSHNLWILKIVLEEKFNLSANYCSHIEEHTNDDIYAEIEKEVVFIEINQKLPFAVRSSISAILFLCLKTWFQFCFHFISEVGVISLEEFPSLLFSWLVFCFAWLALFLLEYS